MANLVALALVLLFSISTPSLALPSPSFDQPGITPQLNLRARLLSASNITYPSVFGGRDGECPECVIGPDDEKCAFNGDCICREMGETCYSDYGLLYDLFVLVNFVFQIYNARTALVFIADTQKKKKKGAKMSSMEKILYLDFVACTIRVLWCIVIFPGRNGTVVLGGPAVEGLLLKIPQILWCGAMFYMACVWKMLYDQAVSMKKANKKDQELMDQRVNRLNIFMVVFIIPAYILGVTAGITILNMFVNLFQLIIIIVLIIGALNYGVKLVKELGGSSSEGAALGQMIKKCLFMAVSCGSCMILAVAANVMGLVQGSRVATYIFWVFVHIPECVAAFTLLYTKRSQRKNKIAPTKPTSAATTAVSTAVEA